MWPTPETMAGVAAGNELVYVPCHRSTMDDLLMPYAIYTHGFAVPHIAAGINLNLPVVGPLLRKGGAFFMRRSFRGSALYTAVFMQYLGAMMARGHPIQYFIEGRAQPHRPTAGSGAAAAPFDEVLNRVAARRGPPRYFMNTAV